jgi:hypothetical protein
MFVDKVYVALNIFAWKSSSIRNKLCGSATLAWLEYSQECFLTMIFIIIFSLTQVHYARGPVPNSVGELQGYDKDYLYLYKTVISLILLYEIGSVLILTCTLGWFVTIFLEVWRIFQFLPLIWLMILQLHLQASSIVPSNNSMQMLNIFIVNDQLPKLYPCLFHFC